MVRLEDAGIPNPFLAKVMALCQSSAPLVPSDGDHVCLELLQPVALIGPIVLPRVLKPFLCHRGGHNYERMT
jgi:hypothetical protein